MHTVEPGNELGWWEGNTKQNSLKVWGLFSILPTTFLNSFNFFLYSKETKF
jgi:hypothetical protein